MNTVETLSSPFKHLVMTIGELPTTFVESMSYYESLAWLVHYIETTLLPTVNANAEATIELQKYYEELKSYVENYFENLDIQTEIDNKLDEMAESGELGEILAQFLESSIYEESITYSRNYISEKHTHYYLAKIPHLNSNNERIVLKHGFASNAVTNPVANQNIVEWGRSNNVTLAVNASVFYKSSNQESPIANHIPGQIIHNGEVISDYPYDPSDPSTWAEGEIWYLGLKEDGTLKKYSMGQQASELIADGVIESFVVFNQCAINGVIQSEGQFVDVDVDKYQWCLIGQNRSTKDFYLFACDGKGNYYEQGLTLREACTIMINAGADDIYRLDSGGSTEFYYKGAMVNQQTDDNFKTIRNIPDFIYFEKEITSSPLTDEMYERDRINGDTLNRAKEAKYTNNFNQPVVIYRKSTGPDTVISQILADGNNDVMSIMLDSTAHPKGFSVWDEANNQSTIVVESTGLIKTPSFTSEDTSWEEIKDNETNSLTLYVRKFFDKMIFFRGSMGGLTANSTYTFTLPAKFSNTFEKISVIQGSGNNTGKLIYGSDGTVTLSNFSSTELYFGVMMIRN